MARIIRFDDSAHSDVQALLPWYVTETLEPAERAQVAAHLARCAQCREEANLQTRLSTRISEMPLDVDHGWRKMERLIEEAESSSRPWAWLEPIKVRMVDAWRAGGPQIVGWSVAFALVLTVGGLIFASQVKPSDYHTLSAASSRAEANAMVVFRPETSARDLSADLLAAHARIVDGPTVAGAYLLEVPGAERKAALDDLRRRAGVLAAEPIDNGRSSR